MRPRDAGIALERLRRVRALYESATGLLWIGLIDPEPSVRRAWGLPPSEEGTFPLGPSVRVRVWNGTVPPQGAALADLDLLVVPASRPRFPLPTTVSLLEWPGGSIAALDREVERTLHRRGPAGRNKALLWRVLRYPDREAVRVIRRAAIDSLLLDPRLDRTERILLRSELLWTIGFIYGRQQLGPAKLGTLLTGAALDAVEHRLLGRLLANRPLLAALVQAGGTLALGRLSRSVLTRRRILSG